VKSSHRKSAAYADGDTVVGAGGWQQFQRRRRRKPRRAPKVDATATHVPLAGILGAVGMRVCDTPGNGFLTQSARRLPARRSRQARQAAAGGRASSGIFARVRGCRRLHRRRRGKVRRCSERARFRRLHRLKRPRIELFVRGLEGSQRGRNYWRLFEKTSACPVSDAGWPDEPRSARIGLRHDQRLRRRACPDEGSRFDIVKSRLTIVGFIVSNTWSSGRQSIVQHQTA